MDFELTDAQLKWRDEVRAFIRHNVTPELLHERDKSPEGMLRYGPEGLGFRKKVGRTGWHGLAWPKEYGGMGRGVIEQYILVRELDYAKISPHTVYDMTVTVVAPTIMRYGTEQNKQEFLPAIARGEIRTALGYSEPDAGTDLASLRTRAELDGDEWVINGSKIWNSSAHGSTHQWLLVRTDPQARRHEGISIVMVPMTARGIEVRPLIAWSDYQTNQLFFTDVRVPRGHLIGEVNKGWQYIVGALDLERGGLAETGDLKRELDELIEACRAVRIGDASLIDQPHVGRRLAELDADVEVAQLYGLYGASLLEGGEVPSTTLTASKVYSSELRTKIADFGMQIFGIHGQLSWRDPDAPGRGAMERLYRSAPMNRFGGGTNEVMRDIIAQRGYGMPTYGRSKRN
ncbi:acyl-CoA dehydrogenase family protein [Bradyrhizobium sp. B124]|uniref:acyl-CoA dehydrogenase family protein n=1 Tax=Bradyrhizobium sp. B124 TaxID=3140245 RepID=UPI003183DD11